MARDSNIDGEGEPNDSHQRDFAGPGAGFDGIFAGFKLGASADIQGIVRHTIFQQRPDS